jgi:hypothetical protein
MASAADLRAEAQRIRDFALTVTDPDVLDQIQAMILELERRARELGNDDALGVCTSMQRMTYRLILQEDKRYSVEMITSTGKWSLILDFRDQAEADAWIVQTKWSSNRMTDRGTEAGLRN